MFVKQLNVKGKKEQRNSNNYDLVLKGPEINDTPLCNSRIGHKVFHLSKTYQSTIYRSSFLLTSSFIVFSLGLSKSMSWS